MTSEEKDSSLDLKERALLAVLDRYTSLGVAFSGGVDSTLLLAAAKRRLGERVIAFTAVSAIHPRGERELAVEMANAIGVRHVLFDSDELADPAFVRNTVQRCYFCKRGLFAAVRRQATALGIQTVAHGANRDDLSDYRPGFRAAQEMEVVAPLIEAGLGKDDIRRLAHRWGLGNWDRPAMACLATRIPYNTEIRATDLTRIDAAESVLRKLGVARCRVRHHGGLACIETDAGQLQRLSEPEMRTQIVAALRSLGYAQVCLDLEGYVSGKMNRAMGPSGPFH